MTGFLLAMVAPDVRTHLSADALVHVVRSGVASLPDPRHDDTEMSCTDTRRSAFAMFALQAPALLAFDQERAAGHMSTLDGMARVPCDTPVRAILDPVSPPGLRPVCTSVCRPLPRGKARQAMTCLDGHY